MTLWIGIDLGGTNVKGAAVAIDGDEIAIVERLSQPTNAAAGPAAVTEVMIGVGNELIAAVGRPAGVGAGVPGLFDFSSGKVIFFTNLPGAWEGHPLRADLARELDLPTTLINDARAFTLAESTVGAGAGCRTVACITLGTGVGGGLFIDGRLHFGAYGIAGELGHQTIDPSGPVCGCGNPGCMEALARPPRIAERAGMPTFEDVVEAAGAGDERAIEALDEGARHLGIGLANIVTTIGPERIVIGGGGADAGELFIGRIRDQVRAHVTLVPPERVQVVAASLGSYAGAVGAAIAAADSPSRNEAFLVGEIPSARARRGD